MLCPLIKMDEFEIHTCFVIIYALGNSCTAVPYQTSTCYAKVTNFEVVVD